jgi:hypothetical protein
VSAIRARQSNPIGNYEERSTSSRRLQFSVKPVGEVARDAG